jgi:hypothetical protein
VVRVPLILLCGGEGLRFHQLLQSCDVALQPFDSTHSEWAPHIQGFQRTFKVHALELLRPCHIVPDPPPFPILVGLPAICGEMEPIEVGLEPVVGLGDVHEAAPNLLQALPVQVIPKTLYVIIHALRS